MNYHSGRSQRIRSIDALRAFTLLGILVMHTCNKFGTGAVFETNTLCRLTERIVYCLVEGRFATIFMMLFGCSFWLILRKPNYPRDKFVFRCLILCCIGLVAKIFYFSDTLLQFGIWGMVLSLLYDLKSRDLMICIVLMVAVRIVLQTLELQQYYITAPVRYPEGATLLMVVSYPITDTVILYIRYTLQSGIFVVIPQMALGLWFAKRGYLTRIDELANTRNILIFFLLCIPLGVIRHHIAYNSYDMWFYVYKVVNFLYCVFGGILYALAFVYIYNRFSDRLRFMEAYGKMCLTNYFCQGIVGITLIYTVFIPYGVNVIGMLAVMLAFYAVQMVFSNAWMRTHQYGPLEGLWRRTTDMYTRL